MRRSLMLLMFCFTLAVCCSAQSPTATITGRVLDPTKAAIPAANITLSNEDTGIGRSTTTNELGLFSIGNLAPGNYRIEISRPGFKSIVKPNIVLHVQDVVALNFDMSVGSPVESITVEAGTPLINTQDASVSNVVDRNLAERVPLNGRSFTALLQLTPGVVIAPSSQGSPGQFSIAGQRTNANNFTVDGVSANFGVGPSAILGSTGTGAGQSFTALGGTSGLVSVEALEEFRVETSSYAPEFGRNPGGQVMITTRAGTNQLHGGLYEYLRNDVFDAKNWFNGATVPPTRKAPERHNDFGGYLGGPLLSNKAFYFLSYEGARLRQPSSQVIQVPSLAVRSSASPAIAPFLNAYPLPNGPIASGGIAQFTGVYSNPASLDAGSARLDYKLNDRLTFFGRYSQAPSGFAQRINSLSMQSFTKADTQTVTVGSDMIFNPRFFNSVRGNFSRQASSFTQALDSFGGAEPLDPRLLIGGLLPQDTLLQFTLSNSKSLLAGPTGRNQSRQANIVDDLTLGFGAHQFKFGGDYRALFLDKNPPLHALIYSAGTLQTFASAGRATLSASTRQPAHMLSQSTSLYWQDTWRAARRLSLTYGLRWEIAPAPLPREKTTLSSWVNVNSPATVALAPAGKPLWSTTFSNVAPRIGLAYVLTEKQDLVLRAGGGVFYDLGAGTSADLTSLFPNTVSNAAIPNVPLPVSDPTAFLPVISLNPPFPAVEGFSPDLKLPRSYQWNVALEKSFSNQHAVSATYVGQLGRKLLRREDLNRPNANFSSVFQLTRNTAKSDYDALQLQYRKPLAPHLQAVLNYTWSHSIDTASDDSTDVISEVVFAGQNSRGSSSFDVRHIFSGGVTFKPPAISTVRSLAILTENWSFDGLVVERTGFPFNGLVVLSTPVPGVFPRPDRVQGQPVWIADSSAPGGKRLNPAALVAPATVRQGTESRNDITGFGLSQVDLSIGRNFPITERLNLSFRTDAFNVLNHPNFSNPQAFVGAGTNTLSSQKTLNEALGGLNPLFQQGGPRSLQLSLKLSF